MGYLEVDDTMEQTFGTGGRSEEREKKRKKKEEENSPQTSQRAQSSAECDFTAPTPPVPWSAGAEASFWRNLLHG